MGAEGNRSRFNLIIGAVAATAIVLVLVSASLILGNHKKISLAESSSIIVQSSNKGGTSTTLTLSGGGSAATTPTTSVAVPSSTTSTTSPLANMTPQEQVVANFAINYNTYYYQIPFNYNSVTQYVDPSISASMVSELKNLQQTYHYYREARVPDVSTIGVAADPSAPNVFYVFVSVEVTSPFQLNQYGQILTKPTEASYKVTLGINNLITNLEVNG
jgi:hypothetical protein